MNRRTWRLLLLTKLDTVFETFEDDQTAVNSFFPGRASQFDILHLRTKSTKKALEL